MQGGGLEAPCRRLPSREGSSTKSCAGAALAASGFWRIPRLQSHESRPPSGVLTAEDIAGVEAGDSAAGVRHRRPRSCIRPDPAGTAAQKGALRHPHSRLSVPELEKALQEFLEGWNKDTQPFVWTARIEYILAKLDRARRKLGEIKPGCTTRKTRRRRNQMSSYLIDTTPAGAIILQHWLASED